MISNFRFLIFYIWLLFDLILRFSIFILRIFLFYGFQLSEAPWDSRGRPLQSKNVLSSGSHDGSKK